MGNIASNFWKYYDPSLPLNVMVTGKTLSNDGKYHVKRDSSRIFAIEYMLKGTQHLSVNGKSYAVGERDAILLTKGSRHEYFSAEPLEKCWMVFDGPLAESLIREYLPANEYRFPECNLAPYFDEIYGVCKRCENDYPEMTDALGVILHRIFIHIKNLVSKRGADTALKIRRFLDSSVEKHLTMDDLCAAFNYSKNYLINIFSKKYGITPYRYFLERKTEVAKLYLCNTHNSVNSIAAMLAYADQNYFSSEFKRMTGISPVEYRKKYAEKS